MRDKQLENFDSSLFETISEEELVNIQGGTKLNLNWPLMRVVTFLDGIFGK
jgi:bacteriocin-like protein